MSSFRITVFILAALGDFTANPHIEGREPKGGPKWIIMPIPLIDTSWCWEELTKKQWGMMDGPGIYISLADAGKIRFIKKLITKASAHEVFLI